MDGRSLYLTTDELPEPWRGMYKALDAFRDHPARAWLERVGNGVFEDDHGVSDLPAPHPIYRFRRADESAYVWQAGGEWYVRPWRPMRGRVSNAAVRVPDLGAALDELTREARPWWRFWGR